MNRPLQSRLWIKGGAALLNQVLLSVFNFAIGIVLVRLASKQQVADYAQISSIVLFCCAALGAAINSPVMTQLPALTSAARSRYAWDAWVVHATGVALLCFGLIALIGAFPGAVAISTSHSVLMATVVVGVAAAATREFVRNLWFSQMHPVAVLRLDILYCALSSALFALLVQLWGATAISATIATALAGAVAVVPWWPIRQVRPRLDRRRIRVFLLRIRRLAKWSLPATLLSWVNVGFPLLAAHVVGADATAEIVAARLFVQPVGPMYVAWNNVFRPRFAAMLAAGRSRDVWLQSVLSLGGVGCVLTGYLVFAVALYSPLQRHLLGPAYHGLLHLVIWWWANALIGGFGGVGTGLLYAMGRFRAAFWSSCFGNLLSLPLMIALGAKLGADGILVGLTAGAALSAAWTLIAAFGHLRRRREDAAAARMPSSGGALTNGVVPQ